MPYADAQKRKDYAGRYNPVWYAANKGKYAEYARNYNRKHPEKYLLRSARARARKLGMECTITVADIVIPAVCPALGISLAAGQQGRTGRGRKGGGLAQQNAPSLDRIDSAKGYIPGNVQVISWRANQIKGNATPDEIRLIAAFMAGQDL